ncbi:MAG: hypothetical protein ACFCUT_09970 [Kiloniellaceae bacterium]
MRAFENKRADRFPLFDTRDVGAVAAAVLGDLAHIASAYGTSDNAASPDLPMLLGREQRSLSQFLEDHRQAFAAADTHHDSTTAY